MEVWSGEHLLGGELLASSPLTPTVVGMSTAAATSEISLGFSLLFVTFIYFDFILLGGHTCEGQRTGCKIWFSHAIIWKELHSSSLVTCGTL